MRKLLDLLMFRTGEILGLKNLIIILEKLPYPFLFCSDREASDRKKNDEEKSHNKTSNDKKVISLKIWRKLFYFSSSDLEFYSSVGIMKMLMFHLKESWFCPYCPFGHNKIFFSGSEVSCFSVL